MTAPAYAPAFSTPSIASYRRRPAYRGPLVSIPGGRARLRPEVRFGGAARPVGATVRSLAADSRPEPDGIALSRGGGADTHPQDLAPPLSPESSRAFQERLRALPAAYEIRLDRSGRSARIDGVTRRLTKREFELLAELAARPGEPVSRDRLLAVGADGRDLGQGSRAVDVHIAHLRDKLALPGVIATVRGRGYALNPAYAVLFAD